jgi:mono/diheme cytochrome c family protein
LKWGGAGFAALAAVLAGSISVLLLAAVVKLHARSAPAVILKVAGTDEQIRRGQTIADTFCSACHSKTGTMTGGVQIGEHFPLPIGSFVCPI